jgi:hypothetical protein
MLHACVCILSRQLQIRKSIRLSIFTVGQIIANKLRPHFVSSRTVENVINLWGNKKCD